MILNISATLICFLYHIYCTIWDININDTFYINNGDTVYLNIDDTFYIIVSDTTFDNSYTDIDENKKKREKEKWYRTYDYSKTK